MKAVLFDLDETLIVDEAVSHQAYRTAALLAEPAGADPALLARQALDTAKALWAEGPCYEYCLRIGHSATEGLWARYDRGDHPAIARLHTWALSYRTAVWREALAQQGIRDESLPPRQAALFAQARRRYPVYPEIPALLNALLNQGYQLGIVTNGVPDLQGEKIAGFGLAHLFHGSVVSGEVDCGKPEPGIFEHICRTLSVVPHECVMVGDNPERDVAGAMNAGMKSVWVSRNGRARDPRYPGDLACTDLSDLITWLEAQ